MTAIGFLQYDENQARLENHVEFSLLSLWFEVKGAKRKPFQKSGSVAGLFANKLDLET